jgi:hypothetical protein
VASSAPAAEKPAPPAELGIEEGAMLGIIGAGAGLIFPILRSKVTAIVLGPAGMGKAAQILQLVTMANLPVTMITGPALVSSVAEAKGRGDHAAIARIVRTATTVVLAVSTLTGLLAVLLSRWMLPSSWGRSAWSLTLLAATAALLSGWAAIPQQVLTAHVALRRLTVLRLGIAAISVALACAGTIFFGLTGQFLALALSALVVLPLSLRAARRTIDVPWAPRPEVDRAFVIRAMRLGISALIAGYAWQGALYTIFWTLGRHLGDEAKGQFSAAWTIGATYFSLLLDGVGSYVSPRYAAAQTAEALSREMDAAARFVFKTTPPTLLAGVVLRAVVIHAVYNDRFPGAIELLGLQMVADICRAVSWVQAGPLLYRNPGAALWPAGRRVRVPRDEHRLSPPVRRGDGEELRCPVPRSPRRAHPPPHGGRVRGAPPGPRLPPHPLGGPRGGRRLVAPDPHAPELPPARAAQARRAPRARRSSARRRWHGPHSVIRKARRASR